jgi:D-3-phosphoglycerate dehydrogenase / 2-oxoglutarate reductase
VKKYRVLVSDKLSENGLAVFRAAGQEIEVDVKVGLKPDELKGIIGQYHALAIRSATKVTKDLIDAAANLKVVGRAGIGVDNVDVPAASKRGIVVMNTPEGNVVTTAEHAIALMCSLVRKVPQATASMRAGQWEKTKFQGRELFNKTLGVVGLGNIGKIVADRAQGLKMKVIAFDPFVTQDKARELGVELVDLDTLFRTSDVITLHVPLVEATKNVINADAIAKMRKGAFLVNAARGGLCDEVAVAEAVKSGRLGGAAFDVFLKEPPEATNPLLGVENVILTPHLGASTDEAQENVAIAVAVQIVDFLKTGAVRNAVNAPSVSAELMSVMGPYLRLARKVGRLAGLMHKGGVRTLRVLYQGAVAELATAPITVSTLTGWMRTHMGELVNEVNAPVQAKERGIEVLEERSSAAHDFASSILVRLQGEEGSTEIVGALFGRDEPRIVSVNGVRLDMVPEGHVLMTRHNDRPGIIGKLGTALGSSQVNISRLTLGLVPGGSGMAHAAISVDSPISDSVVAQLKNIEGMVEIQQVSLND